MSKRQLSQKTDELLDILGLEKERNTLVDSLPLGWKQKLSFSVAIIHEPKIVFLDEPTGGVDPVTRRQFWELIYEAAARGSRSSSPPIIWMRRSIVTVSPSW